MQALAVRTKIKKESSTASTTQEWMVKGNLHHHGTYSAFISIDDNAFDMMSGSTRLVAQSYLPAPSAKAREFLKKLTSYKNLQENWDNNGAVPPEEQLVSKVSSFIQSVDEFDLPLYFIAPGPNGEIVVEYKNGDNTAEVFFNEDGTEEMVLFEGQTELYSDEINMQLLIKHLYQ